MEGTMKHEYTSEELEMLVNAAWFKIHHLDPGAFQRFKNGISTLRQILIDNRLGFVPDPEESKK
jgi:hypothetical protein